MIVGRTVTQPEKCQLWTSATNLGQRCALPAAALVMTVACSSAAPPGPGDSGSRTATTSVTASASPSPGGTTLSASGRGALVAVDARTGQQRWKTALPMATVSEPVLSGGLVVVAGTTDCNIPLLTVAAVQAETGQLVWQRAVPAQNPCPYSLILHITAGIVVAGGPLQPGAGLPTPCTTPLTGQAPGPPPVGLDLVTGVQRWQAPAVTGEVLAATTDTVIARGANLGCLVGLDSASGKLRWTVIPPTRLLFAATAADSAFMGGQGTGAGLAVSAFDPRTGRTGWQVTVPPAGDIFPIAVGDVLVTATTRTSQSFPTVAPGSPKPTPPPPTTVTTIAGLDPATGHQLWRTEEHDDQIWTSVGPGLVLITHLNGNKFIVEAREPRTGVRRWQSAALRGGPPPVTDGAVVLALPEGSAAAFTAADGRPLWTVPGAYAAATVTADTVYLAAAITPKNPPSGGG
jgi:outer membrane protein assembly factor BamB